MDREAGSPWDRNETLSGDLVHDLLPVLQAEDLKIRRENLVFLSGTGSGPDLEHRLRLQVLIVPVCKGMETDAQAEFFPLVTPAMPLYGIDALERGCLLPRPGRTR